MPIITDWLMVIITLIYVIATIAICAANIKSAKATRDQLAESKRQFEEEHRAFITHEFIYENRVWYGMRFTNHGRRVAENVSIELEQRFIGSLKNQQFSVQLKRLHGKTFTLGIDQSYDIFFGGNEFRGNPDQPPIQGDIIYSDSFSEYREHFYINFNDYPPIFTVETGEEKILNEMKKQTKELDCINKGLRALKGVLNQEEKHV